MQDSFHPLGTQVKLSAIILAVLLAAACLISSCRQGKDTSVASTGSTREKSSDTLLAAISRGACFGKCPEYKATVNKDGTAWYEGQRNVEKIGIWKAKLGGSQLALLKQVISDNKMEDKDTAYVNKYLADYPAYFLWVSDRKPARKIYISHESPPEEISNFTAAFEKMLEQLKWTPVNPAEGPQNR